MANLWHLGGLPPAQLARSVWRAVDRDDILGQAAKMSYYFLLALVPLLLLLTTLFGYFAQSADLRADLLGYFRRVVPRSAFQLVVSTLDEVTRGAGGGKLSLGIKWHWATPGAVVAVTLWVTASLGFRLYLRFFSTYATTYGSLGAVIILMLWLYVTSAAILIGAEVNSEIESAAARGGDRDARLPGQKAPGEPRSRRAA